MKTQHYMMAVLASAAFIVSISGSSAQPPQDMREREARPHASVSAEDIAKKKCDDLGNDLDLSDKQYKKVYKLYLKQAQKANSDSSDGQRPSGMGMSGGPGGMQGGGGMGMGGGMPGGGGRPDGMGRGMDGMSGGGMDMDDQAQGPARQQRDTDEPYFEDKQDIAKREKKMKKILSAEQYSKWQQWEHAERQRETEHGLGGPMRQVREPGNDSRGLR